MNHASLYSLDEKLSSILQRMQDRLMSKSTYWGIPTLKNPVDFWVYQEIIYSIKPDYIIEIGNYMGGSTLAFAHMLENLNNGRVIGLDVDHSKISNLVSKHPRIELIEEDAKNSVGRVKDLIPENSNVLVIEDSSHDFDHTLEIIRLYSPLVSVGSYLIVEDGICRHGLDVGPEPGPYEATVEFLKECQEFEIDSSREDFVITWNPCGYLKRIR
ncbi:cephalosporin hydroxylase family protein [Opitutales bacterium]|jgi:cephalosporin hydroxylase|nr:cephalosporin hydroxylase family protein [Opitutales bacterium]|tara:strand:+ start:1938 stop:2579 length:642 start_codon:yes stop_codon:yes gene_type:complete